MTKAVFIDKDGTLVKDVPFNIDVNLIVFEKKVIEGLKILERNGYKKIVISNQPGVALGYYRENELDNVSKQIQLMLDRHGIQIDAFYYCPHYSGGSVREYAIPCDCRKPMPGLIKTAAHDLDISIRDSWMIGDILNDVEAGKRAGCSTVLIDNGGETEWIINKLRMPDHVVKNFLQAANIICKE